MLEFVRQPASPPAWQQDQQSARRSLVIACGFGLPECLVFALQHQFDGVDTVACPDIAAACRGLAHPAALLLADPAALDQAGQALHRFGQLHPLAGVAAMVENERDAARFYASSPFAAALHGILPMNLKLDLWLSVVGLLLRGGEYFPAAMLRHARDPWHGPDDRNRTPGCGAASRQALPLAQRSVRSGDLHSLTDREIDVLKHLARGTQNKLIAAELGLSENTIKIHVHNVIRKLGTRNRTEAAAVFLRGMGPPPLEPDQESAAAR